MRNPSSAKLIAPKGAKCVAQYENQVGEWCMIYECTDLDSLDSLRRAAHLDGHRFKECGSVDLNCIVTIPSIK